MSCPRVFLSTRRNTSSCPQPLFDDLKEPHMAGETILVVEDHPLQREGVAYLLRQHDYTVILAADAEEGLSWVRSEPSPDLILLDMMMRHGKDGWYFLAQRKQVPGAASIPVII